MYDRTISRLALSAIRNLQAETIAHVESNCLFSDSEEELLATVKSVSGTYNTSPEWLSRLFL